MSSHDRPRFSLSEVVAGAGWYPRFPVRFDSLSIIATKYLLSQVLGSDQFTVKLVRVTSYSRSLELRETVTFGYRSASLQRVMPFDEFFYLFKTGVQGELIGELYDHSLTSCLSHRLRDG